MERLILCGGGHVSLELAHIAGRLEFELIVIDDRPEFANESRFPMARRVICAPFLEALAEPLPVPVVWNTGGYERVETLRTLEGKVQIYLPDLKYVSPALGEKYSGAADYFDCASRAVLEMYRQTGPYELGEDGLLRRGVVIRHLVLPGQLADTKRVIDWAARTFRPGQVLFSLMSQYTPVPGAPPELARRLYRSEYRAACAYLENCGIGEGFLQERTAAKEEYTPPFDLTGV